MDTTKPINTLIEDFLSEADCKPNSLDNYRRTLRIWVNWMVVNADIKEPTKAHLLMYRNHLSKHRETSTVDSYMSAVKLLFKYLAEKEIHPNVALGIRRLRKSTTHRRGNLSIDQVDELLSALPRQTLIEKRNYAIINLMVRTGLRCVEVATLNYKDLTVTMPVSELRFQRKGRHEKDALFTLTASIALPIIDYLRHRGDPNDDDPLFARCGQCAGQRIGTQTISHIIINAYNLIGIKDKRMTAHSLRHTAARIAIGAGSDIYNVQQLLGHTNPATTMIYLRELELENKEAASAIRILDKVYKTDQIHD